MKVFKIILSSFIILLIFSFVFVFTYFIPNNSKIDDFQIESGIKLGLSRLIQTGDKLTFLPSTKVEKDFFFQDNLNNLDNIYFLTNTSTGYESKLLNNTFSINIGKGFYFGNIKDLTYKYNFSNNSFNLTPKSSGRFFIDSRDNSNIKIFSLDSILEVTLLNPENKEESTKIILYPHMNFAFNSSRNKLVKNADLLRLETIFEISYLKDTFLSSDINEFVKSTYKKDDEDALNFLNKIKAVIVLQQDYLKYNSVENFIIQNKNTLPGINYITKYFVLLLNDSKKVLYYKDDILKNLNSIAKSSNLSDLNSYISTIKSDIESLRNIDEKEYMGIYNLITYYYENLLKTNDIELVENTFVLSNLLYDLNGFNSGNKIKKSSFLINKLYNIIDNDNSSTVNLQSNLLDYLNSFYEENGIKVDVKSNSISIDEKKNMISDLESLSFFIKNVLLFNAEFVDKENTLNTISLLKNYYYINNTLSLVSESKYESLIVEYSGIIDKILSEIRNSFFEEELDSNNLLVVNKNNVLTRNEVKDLNDAISLFFDFHQKNKFHLSSKNIIYNRFYSSNKLKYDEYHLALDNYNEYIIAYNKIKSDLFTTKTVAENTSSIELSAENLTKFLSNFYGLDVSNSSIKIINNEYYEIKDIYINGYKFSFDLYPKIGNRIQNIYRNGEQLNLSYELDSIKEDLKELYSASEGNDKNKYDFRKFFVNTFFSGTQSNQPKTEYVYEDNVKNQEEDRSISLFKRDKLVGDMGEFSVVKQLLNVKYDDVTVILKDNNYDINISNAELKIVNTTDTDNNILGKFSSKYIFTNEDHYFKGINLFLYRGEYTKDSLHLSNPISIEDNIDIRNFNTDFKKIVESLMDSISVFNSIKDILGVEYVDIVYSKGIISFTFEYNGKEIIILVQNGGVNSLLVSGNNILNNKNINYTEVIKYLKLIK